MSDDRCISMCTSSNVTVEDSGMKANFENPQRRQYRKYVVDGCLVQGKVAADFAVEEIDRGLVVVELKGGKVEHALKQVHATTAYFRNERGYVGELAALIVSRQSPLGAATIARHRLDFARKHAGAALHVHSSRNSFVLGTLMASGRRSA